MISAGRKGVTNNWSNVPCSRSRATDMAANSSVCSMVSVPIRPGIMFQRVSRLGLYHARVATWMGRPRWPWVCRQLALNVSTMVPT